MSTPEPPVVDAVTSADVAALLRARTKDTEGREVGLFTEATRPTVNQVDELITFAGELLRARVGYVDPETACYAAWVGAQRLLAAMWVELSYFPEQVRTERSPYAEYRDLFDQQATALVSCIEGDQPGVDPMNPRNWQAYSVRTNPPYPYGTDCLPGELIANWNAPIDVDD